MNTIGLQQQNDGSFKEVNLIKRITFTPSTANRWYRVLRSNSIISGTLKIFANTPSRKVDVLSEISVDSSNRGTITQTNYIATGGGQVTYLRVARNQGESQNEQVVDVLCSAAGDEITLEGIGELMPNFETNPEIVGSTQYNTEDSSRPWDHKLVDNNKYGTDTTPTTAFTPTGPYFEADVDFYFNSTVWSTFDNNHPTTLASVNTDTHVYVDITGDQVGLKAGRYVGKVVAPDTGNVIAPNGVSGKRKIRIRLRGLDPSKWNPLSAGFVPLASPISWSITIIAGVFNGIYPSPPGSFDNNHLANVMQLGLGMGTNQVMRNYHGNYADPGQPFRVSGRVGYLHALDLVGGAGRFTVSTDHFHLGFRGGLNSGAGFHTPQHYTTWGSFNASGRQRWNNWQQQNSNSSQTNEIFLGGVTEFFFGENNLSLSKYGIDTTRVESTGTGNETGNENNTSPGPPLYDAEVDFYFNSTFTINNNTYVTVALPQGVAGIAAAVLGGRTVGSVTGPLTAPDGATGKYKLTIRLEGLGSTEWYPNLQAFTTVNTNWSIRTLTQPIPDQVDLSVHPTRRDKVIATYSSPHGLTQGQNVVLKFLQKVFIVNPPGLSNSTISKVIDDNTVEVLLGTCRRVENLNIMGTYQFTHNSGIVTDNNATSENLYLINAFPSNYVSTGGNPIHRVKLFSSGTLPTGLETGRDYWMRLNPIYPQYFIKLYNSQSDAESQTNAVSVQLKPAYGVHYMEFQDISPLGPTGWSLHVGNTDPGHQQTFSDAGWHMHRNVYPSNKGIAQGVISQGVYGGLNEVQWFRQKAFAYGWNCSAENDNVVSVGLNIKNNTENSLEIGSSNDYKLRLESNKISTVGTGSMIVGTLSAKDITFSDLNVTNYNLSSNGVDTFLKVLDVDSNTTYGLKLQNI